MKKGFYLKFIENLNKEIKYRDSNTNKYSMFKSHDKYIIIIILNYILNICTNIIKILIYVFAFILISIGITAIINPQLRGIFLNLF